MMMEKDIEALVADLRPVRPIRSGNGAAVALAMAGVAVAIVIATVGVRPDVADMRPHPIVMLREGTLLLLGFASLAAVVASARPGVGRPESGNGWRWALAAAMLFPATSLILALRNGGVPAEVRHMVNGVGCLAISLTAALLVGGALTIWLRRGAPTAINRIGWLVGLTAGSFGTFAYGLRCMSMTVFYVGIWYTAAVALSAVIGRLVVPRFIRW